MAESGDDAGGHARTPSKQPRALIHKKILEAASAEPTASMETLADEISGASVDLVERVLDEYGDPGAATGIAEEDGEDSPDADATDDHETAPLIADGATEDPTIEGERTAETPDVAVAEAGTTGAQSTDPDSGAERGEAAAERSTGPSLDELTEKQRVVLRAIARNPTATQETIATALGVSRATISRRVGDVEGLSWGDRAEFVADLFDDGDLGEADFDEVDVDDGFHLDGPGDARRPGVDADLPGAIDDLAAAVERIEERLDDRDCGSGSALDPDLVHKVVHAAVDADYVSEEEELRLIRSLLGGER